MTVADYLVELAPDGSIRTRAVQLWTAQVMLANDLPESVWDVVAEQFVRHLAGFLQEGWVMVMMPEVSESSDFLMNTTTVTATCRVRQVRA